MLHRKSLEESAILFDESILKAKKFSSHKRFFERQIYCQTMSTSNLYHKATSTKY